MYVVLAVDTIVLIVDDVDTVDTIALIIGAVYTTVLTLDAVRQVTGKYNRVRVGSLVWWWNIPYCKPLDAFPSL